MTEFAVLALVLVPAFIMLPLMGKVSNINQTTIQASRYAAWEMTVTDKSKADLLHEIEHRFYTDPTVLLSKTQKQAVSKSVSQNNLWTGAANKINNTVNSGAPQNTNSSNTTNSAQTQSSNQNANGSQNTNTGPNRLFTAGLNNVFLDVDEDEIPNKAGGALVKGVEAVGALGGTIPDSEWDLETRGLYNVKVRANINSNTYFSGTKDCTNKDNSAVFACVYRNNAILVDGWSSRDADQVEERTRSLVPLGMLKPLGKALSLLGKLPMLTELESLEDAFGYIEPDILPPDRHGPTN